MSSGLPSYSLGVASAFVLRSLMEHPNRQTAQEIADAPHAEGKIDTEGAHGALDELAAHGLAAKDSDGRWHLTDVGREAQQRA